MKNSRNNTALISDIRNAAALIRRGGIVVYPTETVYGIGCDPFNADACRRVRELKRRDEDKPFILIAATIEMVARLVDGMTLPVEKLAHAFWPGPLTMVLKPGPAVLPHLLGPNGGIAFRVTPHPVAAGLSREIGGPLVSTSANRSGETPVVSYEEAVRQFGGLVDAVVDNPLAIAGKPSTVLDMTSEKPVIIRHGGVSDEDIKGAL